MNRPMLIQYPSRGRPQRFMEGVWSIYGNSVDRDLFVINAVLDGDDPSLDTYLEEIEKYEQSNPSIHIEISLGKSESKIDAFNRMPTHFPWQISVAMSDDMRFSVMGWDRLIIDYMPDDLDWFLHFYEKDSAERCSVMNIVGRKYFDRTGYIYHPSYKSLWCDVEETEKARLLDRYLFIPTSLFIHMNPAYGHAAKDEMFEQQQADWDLDEANYEMRKKNNFDLIFSTNE